ncbi:MAG: single-stranded DNA-binding protein [Nitrospinae bacterium]|jgi:single-strand DNA-binding protein|nr:single-stranded DNA-binding protein [Nitrospinota bacterium]MDA1108997.1 single-stranded DNA-binding protein [Nitrospinota bacterium]
MASFNKVLLMGNLTRDPELRYTASGAAVASFGLAVNRKYKAGDEWKEEVCFVDITVWAKQAENCAEYLHKGSPVFVEGRLNYQSWESDTGQKRNKLEVVASTIQFLGRPGDKGVGSDASGGEQFSSGGGDDIPF